MAGYITNTVIEHFLAIQKPQETISWGFCEIMLDFVWTT